MYDIVIKYNDEEKRHEPKTTDTTFGRTNKVKLIKSQLASSFKQASFGLVR